MKKIVLCCGLFLFGLASFAPAQAPDPLDSVFIESKTVTPGLNGSPAFTVKVSITNRDSLSFLTLTLAEQSISGNAYALFASPRNFSVIVPLTNSLRYFSAASFALCNDVSPDSVLFAAGFDPEHREETLEPPNSVRKPVWEMKFKHTSDSVGQVILRALNGSIAGQVITFTNQVPVDVKGIPCVPGIITIDYAKGDLNQDKAVGPADVVLILNAVMLGVAPPRGLLACDLNCDGERTIADVMLLLNAAFLGEGFPC